MLPSRATIAYAAPRTHCMKAKFERGLLHYDCITMGGCDGVVGVDEAGRGALAGPVVAAAVWVQRRSYFDRHFIDACGGINDSKKLTSKQRAQALTHIQAWQAADVLYYAVGQASVAEIDVCNIAGATKLAMRRAVEALLASSTCPLQALDSVFAPQVGVGNVAKLLIDGLPIHAFPYVHDGIIRGDGKSLAIALASIVAKTTRDAMMVEADAEYPHYGFSVHKGYGTSVHMQAIRAHGACDYHRSAFIRKLTKTELCLPECNAT